MPETPTRADQVLKVVQTISIIAGMFGSVWSYNAAREREAANYIAGREREAEKLSQERKAADKTQQILARQPFLKLRQERYEEVSRIAAKLATQPRKSEEYVKALQRFNELYVVELSMVESPAVESAMKIFATVLKESTDQPGEITHFGPIQKAAYQLSHELRNSLCKDFGWDLPENKNESPISLVPVTGTKATDIKP